MSEYKTTIQGLTTGDKVMLRLPDVKGLTDAERENRRIIEATVVAIYPHCILFRLPEYIQSGRTGVRH